MNKVSTKENIKITVVKLKIYKEWYFQIANNVGRSQDNLLVCFCHVLKKKMSINVYFFLISSYSEVSNELIEKFADLECEGLRTRGSYLLLIMG